MCGSNPSQRPTNRPCQGIPERSQDHQGRSGYARSWHQSYTVVTGMLIHFRSGMAHPIEGGLP